MKVWRVARVEEFQEFPVGPYAALRPARSSELRAINWAHCDDNHPSPYSDWSLGGISGSEYCGFDSPEALYQWFEPEWLPLLKAEGFKLYVYDVPADVVRVGRMGQALFPWTSAELDKVEELEVANA